MRNGARFIIVVIALAAGTTAGAGFAYRQEVRDAYAKWKRGPIPEAVSRDEFLAAAVDAPAEPASEGPVPVDDLPAEDAVPAEIAAEPPIAPAPAEPSDFPATMNLKVLFVPQAPFKVWDPLHEDACEEAAIISLQTYVEGTETLTLEEMDARIYDLVAYQDERGLGLSISAEQAAAMMRDHLGLAAKVLPLSSMDDVRRQIAAGRPVILPAAGRLLFNPNFRNGGPLYHMLVAKGYMNGKIITNDPGTRLGADYVYDADVLWNAVRDWNGGDVMNGAKVMIVVE